MSFEQDKITLGFVPANRGSFNAELVAAARDETLGAMEKLGITVVVPRPDQTRMGCVENLPEAELVADLFRQYEVQGIVIGAMNFGDEQSAAWAVRQARLGVPVLVFGCQEDRPLEPELPRRDAFCGLLSIGEALRQIGIPYSVGQRPLCSPGDPSFAADLDWFTRVCRVVGGVRNARYGQVGTRPGPFWTCRFDEKRLQRLGPTTVVIDLSEVIAGARAIDDSDPEVRKIVGQIEAYADTSALVEASLVRSAKLELFLRRWREANGLDALAVQCWTSIQANYGVSACATMSRLGDEGVPCACEADIPGAMSMHACLLAAGKPAALADWNNLHNDDEELANIWHCGVFPASLASGRPKLGIHPGIVANRVAPPEEAAGIIEFTMKPSPLTFCRVTQDAEGGWQAMLAEGQIEDNPARTGGSYGWCRIANLQRLYRDVLLRHFPHHVAITPDRVANVLWEALGNYLGIDMYHATQQTPGLYTPMLPF